MWFTFMAKSSFQYKGQFFYVQKLSGNAAALNNDGMYRSLHASLELLQVVMSFNG